MYAYSVPSFRRSRNFNSKQLLLVVCVLGATLCTTLARQCPDCDAQYWTCKWDCYEKWGYQPICAELISYKTGNAEEVTVFVNQCVAGCYVKAYQEFQALQGFEPKFEQLGDPSCDTAWKRQEALDYESFSSPDAFKYSELLPAEDKLPQWLRDELAALKASPPNASDDIELPLKLEECAICQAGRDISGKAVLVQSDGALAPAGAEGEVPEGGPTEIPLEAPPGGPLPFLPPSAAPVAPSQASGPSVSPSPPAVNAATLPATPVVIPEGSPSSAPVSVFSVVLTLLSLIHAIM